MKPTACPCCPRPVLRVERQTTVVIHWHDIGAKPSQRYGCAVAVKQGKR